MSTTGLSYDFVAPSRIVFGWGRGREVGALARSLGRRAFVVCGSHTLESNGALHEIIESLRGAGVDTVRTEIISREPLVDDVDRSVAFLRENRAGAGDLVLAVGGGSAIDLAKAAGALVTQDATISVLDYLEGVGQGLKIENTPLPVLAMPTTGGTGSEATKNAVISSYDPPFKKSLRSDLMVPRIVLVDPELSVSVPPHITACTGMDAITQLIESLISQRATSATMQIATRGLYLAVPPRTRWGTGLPEGEIAFVPVIEAYRDGAARSAREQMARAPVGNRLGELRTGDGAWCGCSAGSALQRSARAGVRCHVTRSTTNEP